MITQNPVLVLNQNYQPLNICNVKRALALILLEKAESTVDGQELIKSPTQSFNIPIVIRLMSYIHKPIHPKKSLGKECYPEIKILVSTVECHLNHSH